LTADAGQQLVVEDSIRIGRPDERVVRAVRDDVELTSLIRANRCPQQMQVLVARNVDIDGDLRCIVRHDDMADEKIFARIEHLASMIEQSNLEISTAPDDAKRKDLRDEIEIENHRISLCDEIARRRSMQRRRRSTKPRAKRAVCPVVK
jgi:hypothetical protein